MNSMVNEVSSEGINDRHSVNRRLCILKLLIYIVILSFGWSCSKKDGITTRGLNEDTLHTLIKVIEINTVEPSSNFEEDIADYFEEWFLNQTYFLSPVTVIYYRDYYSNSAGLLFVSDGQTLVFESVIFHDKAKASKFSMIVWSNTDS